MENGVREIQRLAELRQQKHSDTSENLADVATRGISVNTLKENPLWWTGPIWLEEPLLTGRQIFNHTRMTAVWKKFRPLPPVLSPTRHKNVADVLLWRPDGCGPQAKL